MAKKKELLFSVGKNDFEIQTFRAGGKGGQHQNKTDSAVRIIHKDSGAVGLSRSDRSQHRNKTLAFERLTKTAKFKIWITKRINEIDTGKSIEEQVEELMKPEHLKIEVKDEKGKWIIDNGGVA